MVADDRPIAQFTPAKGVVNLESGAQKPGAGKPGKHRGLVARKMIGKK